MLVFENVVKVYDNTNVSALNGINLKIEKGEFVFLVGHSGAGKSTLIKLITAEEKPTSGNIIINANFIKEQIINKINVLKALIF